ncbi:5'-nucleotidase, lipoprotein e(P4) family [Bacillus sp. BRMEA1]|uniref:5'-nucleotidase, lipoprotein e(P4) family n=1 Tax=Neobacillus endophyticus TaxID=2738405 RepID=UPI0015633929|nr:5'-nucleotidase, lipoprotein e(P4) family [Neobacillus endophyticus]NRD78316.1 5'-nucleotidase, lipoprotein e(P4) family [Neobacillus endophyticus]
MKQLIAWLFIVMFTFSTDIIPASAQNLVSTANDLQEQNTMSVLWFQTAGEAKALYYQGYNIGKMRLDQFLKEKSQSQALKPAIVLDIDETVLDNSPYQARRVLTGKGDPIDWSDWFIRAEAKPLPGALEFLKYANAKGIEIFYISNRREAQKEATIKNLKKVGAPYADPEHVLLLSDREVGKETRRSYVAKTHQIILFFGDNLSDFSGFDELTASDRCLGVDRQKEEFGKKLIVFPNPMYGDWEAAIYRYNYRKSKEEMMKLRKENLQSYQP